MDVPNALLELLISQIDVSVWGEGKEAGTCHMNKIDVPRYLIFSSVKNSITSWLVTNKELFTTFNNH